MLESIDSTSKAMNYIAKKYNKELKNNSTARHISLYWNYVVDFDTFSVAADAYASRIIIRQYDNSILDTILNEHSLNHIYALHSIEECYFIRILSVIDYLLSLEKGKFKNVRASQR